MNARAVSVVAMSMVAMVALHPALGQDCFGNRQDYAVGDYPYGIVTGDFSGDGLLDLAVANWQDGGITVLYGQADGTFGGRRDFSTGGNPWYIVAGYFNGDDLLDLAVTKAWDDDISVLYGQPDGGFAGLWECGVGNHPFGVASGDFDGDDLADLAVANRYDDDITILYGRSDGTFGDRRDFAVGVYPRHIALGYFNDDDRLDLVVTNFDDGDASVLYGQADGGFGGRQDYALGGNPHEAVTGDFNRDNLLDLAITNFDNRVSVLMGQAGGAFGPRQDYAVGGTGANVATGDFNEDGILDLAIVNYDDDDISVLYGQSDGTFGGREDYAVGDHPGGIVVGDFNDDDLPDLAVTSTFDDDVTVLYHTSSGQYERNHCTYVGADQVFEKGVAGYGSDIGLLDASGVADASHSALASTVTIVDAFGGPSEPGRHATGIAGVLACTDPNSTGMAPGAHVYSASFGEASPETYANLILGFETFASWGYEATVFSGALSDGPTYPTDGNHVVERAIDHIVDADEMVIVIAAGNSGSEGTRTVTKPAGAYNCIAVAATRTEEELPPYEPWDAVEPNSSKGPTEYDRCKPDIVAPGMQIFVPFWNQDPHLWYESPEMGSSSLAAPHVAGAVALLTQAGGRHGLDTDPRIMKSVLLNMATKLDGWSHTDFMPLDLAQGAGQLDVDAAYDQYVAGQQEAGDVGALGWDLGTISSGNDTLVYRLGFLDAGSDVTSTLVWHRHVSGDPDYTAQALSNLNLRLYQLGPDGEPTTAVAESVSWYDNVEHIVHTVPGTGQARYGLVVNWVSGQAEDFALAWSATAMPTHTLTVKVRNAGTLWGPWVWGTITFNPDVLDDPNDDPNDPHALRRYPEGEVVQLTANNVNDRTFKNWRIWDANYPDDANYIAIDTNNPITILMNANRKVKAIFKCGSGVPLLLPLAVLGCLAFQRRRRWARL